MTNHENLMSLAEGVKTAATVYAIVYAIQAQKEMTSLKSLESLMKLVGENESLMTATLDNMAYTINKAEVVGKVFGCFISALEAAGINGKQGGKNV